MAHTSSFTPGRIAGYAKSEDGRLLAAHWAGKPMEAAKEVEFAELLINSNGDRNSYYRIRISPENGGQVTCSYHEHSPPWHDRTWQPKFKSAAAKGTDAWTAEFALPFDIFYKNKTLASEIGFNVRRSGMPGQETHGWQGTSANPGDWGILTGIPARESLPEPDYAKPKPDPFSSAPMGSDRVRSPNDRAASFLAEEREQTIQLGPGSAHPGTTGEVRLELEGFLLAGDPHARGIIWDLAVDEQKGELYVLSDPRQVEGVPELRVFDRQGKYLRTIMPFNPNLAPLERAGPLPQDGPGRRSGVGRPETVRDPLRFALPVRRLVASSSEDGAGARRRPDPVQHLPRDTVENEARRKSAAGGLDLGLPSRAK